VKRGYAAQDTRTRRYGPGPKLLELGASVQGHARFGLQRLARAHLEELTARTGETSNLVVRQGWEGVYLHQVEGAHLVRMFTEIGRRTPLYCTGAGKAILIGLRPEQLDEYLTQVSLAPWTPHTICHPDQLRADLDRAREQGFALDDEERELGVRCVAAPVFDGAGRCVGALSISGPTTRITLDLALQLGPLLRDVAAACSARLGYPAPVSPAGAR
jgi:DNA-binding IclR family transcriptional regulator